MDPTAPLGAGARAPPPPAIAAAAARNAVPGPHHPSPRLGNRSVSAFVGATAASQTLLGGAAAGGPGAASAQAGAAAKAGGPKATAALPIPAAGAGGAPGGTGMVYGTSPGGPAPIMAAMESLTAQGVGAATTTAGRRPTLAWMPFYADRFIVAATDLRLYQWQALVWRMSRRNGGRVPVVAHRRLPVVLSGGRTGHAAGGRAAAGGQQRLHLQLPRTGPTTEGPSDRGG